jgi:hypothetical protein
MLEIIRQGKRKLKTSVNLSKSRCHCYTRQRKVLKLWQNGETELVNIDTKCQCGAHKTCVLCKRHFGESTIDMALRKTYNSHRPCDRVTCSFCPYIVCPHSG